ncbi:MAG TPA: adenylate/guanylate cyclase domain-containing protein [Blastococcus sp.]|nr:adenylate/guanylate cyclase domain-containing protein [Blastococcus sp.]
MRYGPSVAFARNANGSPMAYQVLGNGPIDLVFLLGWPTHLALLWENPAAAEFLHRLASFARVIVFDRVGSGMSDRGPTGHAFEDGLDEIRTVLDAVGSTQTAFFGCHLGGRLALLFAATYPQQTTAVVTFASHPATLRADDYPWGTTPEERAWLLESIRSGVLDPEQLFRGLAPTDATDRATLRWWTTFWLSAASAPESIDEITAMGPVDIRRLLDAVRVPVLVLHRTDDGIADVRASRYMAERMPMATFKELPGDDHFPFFGDQDAVVALTQEFLTGSMPASEPDRVVLTVLFTDIVGSTERAAELGDRRWRRLLEEHDTVVRTNLARFRGREVETTGDGFLTTFDGPARAIRAAAAMRDELTEQGLQIRVGLHTGECELVGDHIRGIAVHIAARVLARAEAAEILCSRTVKDLVAGSGFRFATRGSHRLKGVPDEWELFAVDVTPP